MPDQTPVETPWTPEEAQKAVNYGAAAALWLAVLLLLSSAYTDTRYIGSEVIGGQLLPLALVAVLAWRIWRGSVVAAGISAVLLGCVLLGNLVVLLSPHPVKGFYDFFAALLGEIAVIALVYVAGVVIAFIVLPFFTFRARNKIASARARFLEAFELGIGIAGLPLLAYLAIGYHQLLTQHLFTLIFLICTGGAFFWAARGAEAAHYIRQTRRPSA
jgi:hypothetical protein